jgi:hypothetical protein
MTRADLSTLPDWPRLLTLRQAAAYCQVTRQQFLAACPVAATRLLRSTSPQSRRWDRCAIDRWLDSLAAGGKASAPRERWLERLDADDDAPETRPAH